LTNHRQIYFSRINPANLQTHGLIKSKSYRKLFISNENKTKLVTELTHILPRDDRGLKTPSGKVESLRA